MGLLAGLTGIIFLFLAGLSLLVAVMMGVEEPLAGVLVLVGIVAVVLWIGDGVKKDRTARHERQYRDALVAQLLRQQHADVPVSQGTPIPPPIVHSETSLDDPEWI